MDNFPKAYKEVYEILKYIPEEYISKIPNDLLQTIEENMDKNYNFEVDISKNLEEQETLEETNAMISIIYKDYWADPERRKELNNIRLEQKKKIEQEKRDKYNTNMIFEKKLENKKENFQMEIIKEKKTNFFTRFILKIKGFFR